MAPLFVLTCMRSYSSLCCAMLGQHPELYGLPEVNLTVVKTMGQWLDLWGRVRPLSMHGLLRTVAQLEYHSQTTRTIVQAKQWVEYRSHWSTHAMFHYLAQRLAPKNLVEKSPSHVLDVGRLYQLQQIFPHARFLHLTRHPTATCRSIRQLAKAIEGRLENENTYFNQSVDAESLWKKSHENILKFWPSLKPGQGMRLQGELLLQHPEIYLPQITEWLQIRRDEAAITMMYHPETSPFACFGPTNARFGNDPNFLKNPFFRPKPIESPPPLSLSEFSSDTQFLARLLGYR